MKTTTVLKKKRKTPMSQQVASPRRTAQSEPIPGSTQVQNNAGGFSWAVDCWKQLDRFLVLGSEGGSFYASEQKLTKENAAKVIECIKLDAVRVVNRAIEISDSGRAFKNEPAIFVFALVTVYGVDDARKLVYENLSKVCRISTHLFHFAQFVDDMRGWGSGLRNAVGRWYLDQEADQLAYQIVKYQQRDGWAHRDLLRLAHPKAKNKAQEALFRYVVSGIAGLGSREVKRIRGKKESTASYPDVSRSLPKLIKEVEKLSGESKVSDVLACIRDYNLPHEAIPTEFKGKPEIWSALLENGMPVTALLRNLANMTRIGTLKPLSTELKTVVSTLTDDEALKRARIHPLSLLIGLKTYASGRSARGTNTWTPIQQVADALDSAFYRSFKFVEPTGKSHLLALDVSGSMTCGSCVGCDSLTPREASAAMALVTANVEENYHCLGFSTTFMDLAISPKMRLDKVIKYMNGLPFAGTDCSLPMIWALEKNAFVDLFCVYTDNETFAGRMHPSQALQEYRRKVNPNARLAVIAMTSGRFSIADPNDSGMLDVVGFDSNTPALLSNFALGNI